MHFERALCRSSSTFRRVAATLASVPLVACGGASATSSTTAQSSVIAATPAPNVVKLCLDPTSSSAATFALDIVNVVSTVIATWVPHPPPGPPSAVQPAVAGLNLWVRTVSTNAYATDQQSLQITVPSVRGLSGPPPIDDIDLADHQLAWSGQMRVWRADVSEAEQAAAGGADALRHIALDQSESNRSAIAQCLAALAGSGRQDATVRMILASDLQNNEPPISAAYNGSPVLIVQSCPTGTETTCSALAEQWAAGLGVEGAGAVTVVRSDASGSAIAQFMKEGST